ncbi:MAG: polyphosphate:AMP phosphotransferase [Defluviitaleaceae bacterium]|nr:polyphosphate:AMP phosphotransferase [Defluviitaleaceae bacterium]
MLTDINPEQRMEKKEYKEELRPLEDKLTYLQQKVREAGLRVIVVFEGWGASGKGTHISRLVNPLDPRYFDVRTTGKLTEDKQMRPFLWSFWTYLPSAGQIVIMDKSWHRLILPEMREAWGLSNMEAHGFYFDVNAFERQLADDNYLIIKLFLHISKDEQSRRFKALEKDTSTAWRLNEQNREQNKNYDHNLRLYEKMLKMTNTEANPWHVIEADDSRYGTCKMLRIITDTIESRLNVAPPPETRIEVAEKKEKIPRTLNSISPDETIGQAEYREAIEHYQHRMRMLSNKMYAQRRSAAIVYEGWDAAGKGGNIKRLTSEMDPRCYAVVPVGPPRGYEFSRHYLWRFMVKMPKDGHTTIFDRSWYGRVLVERVDEITPVDIWQRAYREINEFEQHLVGHGMVMLKFWLHIDKDEQLRRFESRQSDPLKHHKITEDDWRNREKWDLYESAVDEMLMRTHTPHSPWIIVESNSKKYARIKVLQTVTDALEDALR